MGLEHTWGQKPSVGRASMLEMMCAEVPERGSEASENTEIDGILYLGPNMSDAYIFIFIRKRMETH